MKWTCDWPEAKSQTFSLYQGETATFEPTFRVNGRTVTNATIEAVWYQTNGMGQAWWRLDNATFAPSNDVGAAAYRFFVEARSTDGGRNYRANGALRMLPSPGFEPTAIEPPIVTLDFANIEVANAPWLLPEATNDFVRKSGDTMTGNLTIQNGADGEFKVWKKAPSGLLGGDKETSYRLGEIYNNQGGRGAVLKLPYVDDGTLARVEDIPGVTSNVVTKTYVKDLGISSEESDPSIGLTNGTIYVKGSSITPLTAETADFAPSSLASEVSALSDSISTIDANKADRSELADFATPADVYRIVAGTNVVLVITNYNSAVHAPSMKLQHLDQGSGQYVAYWDEARGHGITLTNAMDYADGVAARLDAAKAPRAWSRVTSGLGADAPDGTTFISTPVTHISGGFEFEKKITAGGTVWTLCSTSLAAGSTTNGFFEISSLDGTPVFSVEKTDSVLVGVNASAIAVVDNACVISVPAVADTHPFARVATTLVNPTWYRETEDGMPAQSPATVSWSGQSGAWVATVDFGSSPQGFLFFEYLQEGGVKIVNSAVVDLSQGVHYGGATYMPTVSGNELKFIRQ